MKRTGELALGIIGIILSGLMIFVGMLFMWISKTDEFKTAMMDEFANDPSIKPEDFEMIFNFMSGAGWALIIAAVLGVIFGLIGVLNIKGNKNPKLAGWLFIAGTVSVGVISVGFGFLPALLFLIAGIMCLVRKPPVETNEI
ncbi:DUF4064 domain-containing protein [Lederbergia citrea]|uniref:DUF4064 domain-containing protein n=1 Tax=Lederbergia citrea TaxID=2833581 RepID=A0A942UIZ0_9BACI|nr:DUF4064 domain-containing protein [Lederbergia citrea]MBS4177227.1 DUF4064 domain-containing protein [Lederbergia citrea]MBS4203890.1 DUF4064 domain-containing protein [Lederbergia citrea]MBS4221525.1 DUF4064 domain-containing protein [Lederbergia citrea]